MATLFFLAVLFFAGFAAGAYWGYNKVFDDIERLNKKRPRR